MTEIFRPPAGSDLRGGLGSGADLQIPARIPLQSPVGSEEPTGDSFPPGGSQGCCRTSASFVAMTEGDDAWQRLLHPLQLLNDLGEILRQGGADHHRPAIPGMSEAEHPCVEALAVLAQFCLFVAVDRVT